jgi:hypothetical protein
MHSIIFGVWIKAAQLPQRMDLTTSVGALYIFAFFNQKASLGSSGLGGPYPYSLKA